MKTVVSLCKVTEKCSQLKHKHTAVQTSISSTDFCQMMGSDSGIIQVGKSAADTVTIMPVNMLNFVR
jgi:hypothetical protein